MKKLVVALALLLAPLVVLAQLYESGDSSESVTPLSEAGGVVPPQVTFGGGLEVGGTIDAKSGIRFPDGTVQLTAAGSPPDLTANAGLYNNRIVEFSPPAAYTEVCFKEGEVQFDIHTFGESTTGGSCVPGDVGWVIERDERTAEPWEDARVTCLLVGMRLPEPFEFKFSCLRDGLMGLSDIAEEGETEWAANAALPLLNGDHVAGVGVASLGGVECKFGGWGWVALNIPFESAVPYRCVR